MERCPSKQEFSAMAAASVHPASPDPLVEVEDPVSPDMDYAGHIAFYNAFLGAGKWFIIHLTILIVALYFFIIQGAPLIGGFLLACSIGLLIYGFLRRGTIRDDLAAGLSAAPTKGAPVVDHRSH
jgi:hypothetical protein